MTSVARHERISGQLVDLKMPGSLEALDEVLRGVDSGSLTGSEAIEKLLGAQISLRNNRRLVAAMRSSRLPAVKTLEDFDFTFQPSLRREQIDSLHELDFVRRKENVVFLGPPGWGRPTWRSAWRSGQPSTAGRSTTARCEPWWSPSRRRSGRGNYDAGWGS